MISPEQAREKIWARVAEAGPYRLAARAGVSPSILYQYRDGARLGRASVTALAPYMPELEAEVWLAAMGVALPEAQAEVGS